MRQLHCRKQKELKDFGVSCLSDLSQCLVRGSRILYRSAVPATWTPGPRAGSVPHPSMHACVHPNCSQQICWQVKLEEGAGMRWLVGCFCHPGCGGTGAWSRNCGGGFSLLSLRLLRLCVFCVLAASASLAVLASGRFVPGNRPSTPPLTVEVSSRGGRAQPMACLASLLASAQRRPLVNGRVSRSFVSAFVSAHSKPASPLAALPNSWTGLACSRPNPRPPKNSLHPFFSPTRRVCLLQEALGADRETHRQTRWASGAGGAGGRVHDLRALEAILASPDAAQAGARKAEVFLGKRGEVKKRRLALIVLNRQLPAYFPLLLHHASLAVAADGAANFLKEFYEAREVEGTERVPLLPSLVCGDFDSARPDVSLGYSLSARVRRLLPRGDLKEGAVKSGVAGARVFSAKRSSRDSRTESGLHRLFQVRARGRERICLERRGPRPRRG